MALCLFLLGTPSLPTSLPNPCPTPPCLRKFPVVTLQGQFSVYLPGSKLKAYQPWKTGVSREKGLYLFPPDFPLPQQHPSVALGLRWDPRSWVMLGTHNQEDHPAAGAPLPGPSSLQKARSMPSLRPAITPRPSLSINEAVDQGSGAERQDGVEHSLDACNLRLSPSSGNLGYLTPCFF